MAQPLLLNELHRVSGATLGPWQDWMVPRRFSDPDQEYQAVRQRAGLIDWSAWGLIEVGGTDRVGFLHSILTNDIKQLASGSGCEAGLVSPSAKLLADLIVLADAECHWLLVNRSRAEVVLNTLDRYLITEQVTLRDHTQTTILLSLQGPTSLSVMSQALGTSISVTRPLEHHVGSVELVSVRIVSHSVTGEPGVVLAVVAENAAWLWDRLMRAGAKPVGWEALNVLRIEAGIPWYGIDMDDSNLLPETGLESRAVSYTKGCYVGQEVMARLETYGSVSRRLVGLVCEDEAVPQPKDAIFKDSEAAGEITSACFSPRLKKPIALGYVKRPHYEAGTGVTVNREGKAIPAKLVNLPFLQPMSKTWTPTP